MHISIHRSTAIVISAVLAGSVVAGISPAAADPSTCVATVLKLPDGTPGNVHSSLSAADPTGRYQVGFVTVGDEGDTSPLFWTAGEPQVLAPFQGMHTSLLDVNSKGTVLGATEDSAYYWQPWLYSNGTARKLVPPANMKAPNASALNERGDVVGTAVDKLTGRVSAVVWPANGKPRRLLAQGSSYAVDINDAGVVIGGVTDDETDTPTVWKRWDARGSAVKGSHAQLTKIRGNWFVGVQSPGDGTVAGGLWNTRSPKPIDFPTFLDAVNSVGDVAYFDANGSTVVARRNGTQYAIDAPGYNTVEYLFEPGSAYDAAGDRDYGFGRAVLWSGCSS